MNKKKKEKIKIYKKLCKSYLSDEKVGEVAYRIWEEEGRPDGHRIVNIPIYGDIKIKELHWLMAYMRQEDRALRDSEREYIRINPPKPRYINNITFSNAPSISWLHFNSN